MESQTFRDRTVLVRATVMISVAVLAFVAARPRYAQSQTSTDHLRQAVVALEGLVDRFRRTGAQPSEADVAPAETALRGVADASAARGDWASAAEALIRLDQAARMTGRWSEAIARADQAAQAARRGGDTQHETKALMDRAKAELANRNLAAAAAHAEAAARLAGSTAPAALRFDTLDVLAQVQTALDRTNAAAVTLSTALSLKGVKDDLLVYGYLDRAGVYLKIAERCEHETQPSYDVCLKQAVRGRAEYLHAADIAGALGWNGLAGLAQQQAAGAAARAELTRREQVGPAGVAASRVFHPRRPSDVLVTDRFVDRGGLSLPMPILQQFPTQMKSDEHRAGGFALASINRSEYVDGLVHQMRGDHAGALDLFLKATAGLEQDLRALPDDASRAAFFDEYFEIYEAATLELLDAGRREDAFAMMERSRARAMADLLASRRLDLGETVEGRLYGERTRLDAEIATKQARLFAAVAGGATREQIAGPRAAVDRLQEQRRKLQARIAAGAPRLQQLSSAPLVSLATLQALARQEHADVIEYLATESALVVWRVGGDSVEVRNVFLPRPQLESAAAAFLNDLAPPSSGAPTAPFDHTRARELYLQLVQPVRQHLSGDRLVIIPHDALVTVPFEALEDPADGVPLGARFSIAYAPSATIWADMRPWSPAANRSIVALADPDLEADGREAARVGAVYGDRAKVINAALPPKRGLAGLVDKYDVVHLSVHGHFSGEQPLLSFLQLAPGPPSEEGRLTAAEMFGLPLRRASLLVLSACESGRVESSRGNDVLGMVRGLLYAGTGAVVLSRWSVRAESTALWMETFHREAQTRGLADAARRALSTVRADPRYAHPYHWAPFTLVGRPS